MMDRLISASIDNVGNSVAYLLFVDDCVIVTRANFLKPKPCGE